MQLEIPPLYTYLGASPYSAELCLYKPWRPKVFFQFEIITNVLVSSFHVIRCYGFTAIINFKFFSAGTEFRCQNMTSIDVRF